MTAITKAIPIGSRALPLLATIGSTAVVGSYVRSQLTTQSRTFDRYFSQQNSVQSEAARAKAFEGSVITDPRTSLFNILGW